MVKVEERLITTQGGVVYIFANRVFNARARGKFTKLARREPNLALVSGWTKDYKRGRPMCYLMVQKTDAHAGQYRSVFWGKVTEHYKEPPTRRDAILISIKGVDDGVEGRLTPVLHAQAYVDQTESGLFVPNYHQPDTVYYLVVLNSYGQFGAAQARMRVDEALARLTL